LRRSLGIGGVDDVGVLNHAAALARAGEEAEAAATLVRVFFLEAWEPLARLRRALGEPSVDVLVRGGWLRRQTRAGCGGVVARMRIDPVGERYLISDLRFRASDRTALGLPAGDDVYPPSSDSILLADAVAVPEGGRALDLCTGSGVQALRLAERARSVVAIDINPRAAEVARRNAALNRVANIDVRAGDLYAPVRGESFDVIVANPPFVTSPYDDAPSYHAGGPTGDRVLRRVVRGWAGHLSRGGRGFAVSHVGIRRGTEIADVARRWFDAFPGRALVLVVESGSDVDLAAAQSLCALRGGLKAYAAEMQRWLQYLRRHRIETVSLVLIAAERTGRRRLEVVDARPRILPLPLAPGPSERIARWLR
jgi:carbamoyltransferase